MNKIFLLGLISFFSLSACSKNVEINNVSGYLINVSIDGSAQGTVADGATKKLSVSAGDHYADAYYNYDMQTGGASKYDFPRQNFSLSAFSGEYKIIYK